MKQSSRFKGFNRKGSELNHQSHAFTLTELLVVIVTLAVLAMVALPVLAGAQNKGGRMQCAANLRQIYVASMVYATEYRGWLPINTVHTGSGINKLNGMHYTYFVTSPSLYFGASKFLATNASASYFSDLGLLYRCALAGNGQIFYCPEQSAASPLAANLYMPLLTTDGGGTVRSSYSFNPRTFDPTNGVYLRAYQKTSDLPPHKLFMVDYFGSVGAGGAGFTPHFREGSGWNVLFTDGSVQFSRNAQALNLIQNFTAQETVASQELEYQILNLLELDH